MRKNKGITLVALVVTIIILIILATISIRMVIGEGGLIWQANNAKVEYRAATVDEEVLSWKAEKQVAEFNDKVQPQTRDELIEDQLKRGLLTPEEAEDAKDDGQVKIGSRVIDYGEDGGVPNIPDGGSGEGSEEGSIKYTNFNWPSIGKAEVTVNKNAENKYSMEYQVYKSVGTEEPTKDWTPIENGGKVENLVLGNVVKTAFTDGKGNRGGTADFTVTDTVAPKAEVDFGSATTITIDDSVTATVDLIDEQSGIDLSKCKWVYNTDNSDILDDGSYTGSFTGAKTKDIALTLNTNTEGTYYLHILSVDKAGNTTITTYGPITVNPIVPKVGDIVNYTPKTESSTYTLTEAQSGYSSSQTLNQEKLTWQIMSINDDETIDILGRMTPEGVHFVGATGYNNGVYYLNEICQKLYSNSDLGVTARSLDLCDIKKMVNAAGLKAMADADGSGNVVGTTKTYTGNKAYYPNIYAYQIGAGIDTQIVRETGLSESDDGTGVQGLTIPQISGDAFLKANSGGLTVRQTLCKLLMKSDYFDDVDFYNLIFGSNQFYYLSTRYADLNSRDKCAEFRFALS